MALCRPFRLAQIRILPMSSACRHGATVESVCIKAPILPEEGAKFDTRTLAARAVLLANATGISPKKMQDYLKSNSGILSVKKEKFEDITNLIQASKFTADEVLKYPRLFYLDVTNVKHRIAELQSRGIDARLSVVTMATNKYKIRLSNLTKDIEVKKEYYNHKSVLIQQLHCSDSEAELILKERSWLKNTKIATITKGIAIIQSYGVSNVAIVQRLHVVIISHVELERQLSILQDKGIYFSDYTRTYLSILNARDSEFQKTLQRKLNDREILQEANCKTKDAYILYRLKCTSDDLSRMLRMYPTFLSLRLRKLKQNLDALLGECNFSPGDIISNPRCLSYANSTLVQRCEALDAISIDVTPALIRMSNLKFHQYIVNMSPK